MRYAGPREAIFHAIVRKNYGCTSIMAGIMLGWVTTTALRCSAHFDEFESAELGIVPMKFEHAFYCTRTQTMATTRPVPAHQLSAFTCQEQKWEMLCRGNAATGVFASGGSGRVGVNHQIYLLQFW